MTTALTEAQAILQAIIAQEYAEKNAAADPRPMTPFDLDALLSDARNKLGVVTATPEQPANEIIPTDPAIVIDLVTRAAEFKRQADVATKERAKITDLLAELTGEGGELIVNGAPIFTVKTVVSRVLDATYIKSVFPDLPENAEMWKDQAAVRRDYK